MSQFGTSAMIGAWRALPGAGGVPRRADFDPMSLASISGALWSADRDSRGRVRIRLAGDQVERLHGRPLTNLDWLDLWSRDSRADAAEAARLIFAEGRPHVVVAFSPLWPDLFEIVLTPMRDRLGAPVRIVGAYGLAKGPKRPEAVGPLTLVSSTGMGAVFASPLSLVAVDGRRTA